MKRVLLAVAFVSSLAFGIGNPVYGDEIVTTKSGKKVKLKNNGTWQFIERKNTSSTKTIGLTDLVIDLENLIGQTVMVFDIQLDSCSIKDCYTEKHQGDFWIDISKLPRPTRKNLLKCQYPIDCYVTVTGTIKKVKIYKTPRLIASKLTILKTVTRY